MSWFNVQVYPENVFRITEPAMRPLASANIWLVVGERSALLIDAGIGVAPLAPVVRGLTALPVTLLVSHTHYDHIGGAHEFADRRVHRAEAAALAAPTPETAMWEGYLVDDSFARKPDPAFDVAGYRIAPAPASRLVEDGEWIDLGGRRLEMVHAPGHSPGLLAVFEPAKGLLFSSDALYDGEMFFNLPGSDPAAGRESIRRLRALAPQIVHPGHFESLAPAELAGVVARALAQAG